MKHFLAKVVAVGLFCGCVSYQPCLGESNSNNHSSHKLYPSVCAGSSVEHGVESNPLIASLRDEPTSITKSIFQVNRSTFSIINVNARSSFAGENRSDTLAALAKTILLDARLDTVQARALRLLTGFAAGTSYGEVWIRDFNTFIRGSLQVAPREKVKEMLLRFFQMQGDDGNIVDGFIPKDKASGGYDYRYTSLAPEWAAHKNTVETDQESSLVQAIKKYIDVTGDTAILYESIAGKTVLTRMEDAFAYLLKDRWSEKYGLITGATTIDWGDVQPEKGWGVRINEHTKWAIDIYDNAMLLIALHDFSSMLPNGYKTRRDWNAVATGLRKHVRQYLWQQKQQKYLPHLYLNGSPFSASFDEAAILYTGGTACAVLAGLHSKTEISAINRQMLTAAGKDKYATIGITVYPPYPEKEYPNMKPYVYQNAGDWTWFGARMVQALIANGFAREAYQELCPMIDRTLQYQGFHEWYDVETGAPKGSGDFRGEAGVLYDAIVQLRKWAKLHA